MDGGYLIYLFFPILIIPVHRYSVNPEDVGVNVGV